MNSTTTLELGAADAANTYLSPTGPAVGAAVTAMGTAATQLVGDVNTKLLANGAKYVVVASIPDFADIPALAAYSAAQKGLVDAMVTTFNSTLQAGLAALPQRQCHLPGYVYIHQRRDHQSREIWLDQCDKPGL